MPHVVAAAVAASLAGAAAVAVATSVIATLVKHKQQRQRTRKYTMSRGRTFRPSPFCLERFKETLVALDVPFESYFRLPQEAMESLIERVSPHLRQDTSQAHRTAGHSITPTHRVAIALRWMAGAQWQDILIALQPVSRGEMYKSVWLVVDAINCEYCGEWSYPTPVPGAPAAEMIAATQFWSKLELRFREKSPQQCMEGVIGAIDGCILETMSPGSAVPNPKDYYCERKKMFGMLLMAASDADMMIRFWDMRYSPKTHDSTAWKGYKLGAWVEAGHLTHPFCFLGDKAFRPGSASLLTPGTTNGTTDVYKYVQSRGRMPAEQYFGVLLRTWGVLWRPLEVKFERRAPLISALINLHNIRRTGGAALDVQGGHDIRHVDGKEQWGIRQRAKKNGTVQSTVVWHDAPVVDADGRPTELLGLVNRGAPGPAPCGQPRQDLGGPDRRARDHPARARCPARGTIRVGSKKKC